MANEPRPAGRRRRRRRGAPARERTVDLERYRSIIPEWADFQAAALRPEPTVFRVRWGKVDEDAVLERLHAQGFRTHPLPGQPGFHQVDEAPHAISLTQEHWLGWIYVQQASTGVAAPELAPLPGERVLDLCAAPGGKTSHMAELMGDSGCLIASEISEPRIRGLLGNVYRLGHTNVLVVAGDGRDLPEGPEFDRVLLDAPCSGEGTLRRRGGKPPNQSRSFVSFVTSAQRALLDKAVRMTKPGGVVLYVTCTFAPEENEAVVSDALARLPVELEPLELPVPHAPGLESFEGQRFDPRLVGAARIYPHHMDSGGLFLAKLRKLDDGASARGWSPPSTHFPGEDAGNDEEGSRTQMSRGVEEICDRFGVEGGLGDVRWLMRGGRAWMHTLREWPLDAWASGKWRTISLGFRAIDFDSTQRPRPTNDLLRWLGSRVTQRVVDLGLDEIAALARREAIATSIDDRGPIALRYHGDLIGRGAVTRDGLKSEIPKARAGDLIRILGDSS